MKRIFYTLVFLGLTLGGFAQSEDDVVVNEFVVNPTTGKEYVELLVVGNNVDLQGWSISDVSSRTNSTTTTEGDFRLPTSATYLASVPKGTYIVLEFTTPVAGVSSLVEDTSLSDLSPRTLIIKTTTAGVTLGGTIDISTSDNFQIYAGTRAAGTLIDQVLCGTNASLLISGATWGDNSTTTATDNVNGGSPITSNSCVRFNPSGVGLIGFQNNDSGSEFAVDLANYGTPGTTNTGVNDFAGALPVKYTSFTATKQATSNLLKWSTASESNNSHFEVQRSVDGKSFETIARVKGNGTSNKLHAYTYQDVAAPAAKTVYYRLKQVDFDGKSELSKTVSVVTAQAQTGINATLPNPFANELSIGVQATTSGVAQIELMDMIGKLHHSSTEALTAGANTIDINTTNVPDGIYFVRVSLNGETFTRKVVKK